MLFLSMSCRVELGPPEGGAVPEGSEPAGEVWIYTSMYPSVLEHLEPLIRERLPAVEPKFYQAGSEKVAQRIEAEWSAGGSPACLVLTSDPFWYARSEAAGRFVPHFAPDVLKVDRALLDDDGTWVSSRLSLMVLAVNTSIPEAERPQSFAELTEPAWRDKISIGDPLASGSSYTWLAFLARERGMSFVEALHDNGVVAAGGSSAVLGRISSGERPVGVLLLENVLAKPSPSVQVVMPKDGAILVPGPIALTAECRNKPAARAIYDLILSEKGQKLIVEGDMYAALPGLPPPEGAPALSQIAVRPWEPHLAETLAEQQAQTKEQWAALVAR